MAEFKPAIDRTMKFEDDPRRPGRVTTDAGGRTRFGIAQKFHPDLPEEFFTKPADEALEDAEQILEADYWDLMHLAEIEDQDVANKLFDMGVNMGVHQAGVYAQRAANFAPQFAVTLKEDGVLGSKSIAAINAIDPVTYRDLLCQFSAAHYRHIATNNPAQAEYLHGWLTRAEA